MSNNKAFKVKNGLELADYNKSIADTAVDIFVYDTRKDSDGGAWRKRTQHTSWYNEDLNTATRGSRKEFPAVAVIVAESNQVTIYDGDDPDLPMWMVFNASSGNMVNNQTLSSLTALNGELSIGGNAGTSPRFTLLRFIPDTCYQIISASVGKQTGIVDRNASLGNITVTEYGTIVNNTVNDVAMTVLPNAPIDAATGLPVPTIAVATDGGVSVIKDDGTVVDSSLTIGISSVSFTENNALVYNRTDLPGSAGDNVQVQLTIPTADGFTADQVFSSTTAPASNKWNNPDVVGTSNDDFVVGSGTNNIGFNYISNEVNDKTSGMTAQVTSEFNSGWQNGDIKLATLSDTDATNVTGSELVTNGTFEANSDWLDYGTPTTSEQSTEQVNSGTYSWKIVTDASVEGIRQEFGSQSAGTYVISGSFYSSSGYLRLRWRNNADSAWLYDANVGAGSGSANTWQTFSVTVTDTTSGTGMGVRLVSNTTTVTFYVDDISVRLAEEDRSVNGNGLQVFGTVTKSAVSSGADLVAYRANDTSSGLVQPHNTDFEFGTGDFSFMFWGRQDASASLNGKFLSLGDTNSAGTAWTGPNINIDVNNAGLVKAYITDDAYVTNDQIELNADGEDGNWYCYALVRRGNRFYGYKNGELNESVAVSNAAASLTNDDNKLCVLIDPRRVAGNTGYGSSTEVDIALLRVSATAPSPEQIKKIYEDEKVLFQENAKAVLYGSSDAVTALAYDTDSELLHVGTSAGRSVFQGLRRVDNTTTAVGAAISASNGLVADE